jgi:signal transduction histidine kinase
MMPAILRLVSLSMDVLILSSLLGYSIHELAQKNKLIQEESQRVRAANVALDAALAENTQMLTALTMSVKSNNMGVLMASLAHELSQPLQMIRTKTELLASMPELQNSERQWFIQGLIQDNKRASDIIVQLRKFLRSGSSDFNDVHLDQVVAESLVMVQMELTRCKITLTQEVESDVVVWANEAQLQMVVLNLLKNALDVLRTAPLPREIHLQLKQSEQATQLTVSDNGPGVTESQRAHVFEMFYSTKKEGMGLGLWLSHSILKHHGGLLEVSTSPSGGACFTMTLPHRSAPRNDS